MQLDKASFLSLPEDLDRSSLSPNLFTIISLNILSSTVRKKSPEQLYILSHLQAVTRMVRN